MILETEKYVFFKDGRTIPRKYENFIDDKCNCNISFYSESTKMFTDKYREYINNINLNLYKGKIYV